METNAKSTPVGKPLLHKDLSVKPRKEAWNYWTAVGMLSYLQGNSRPDMPMEVHQISRFCNNPMLSHERDIKRLRRYLLHTKKEGIIRNLDILKGLECYGDTNFASGWSLEVGDNADNVIYRTGMVIMFSSCPVYWRI